MTSYPSDGRLTSLNAFTGTVGTSDLLMIVSPGNATAGVNYKLQVQTLVSSIASNMIVTASISGGGGTVLANASTSTTYLSPTTDPILGVPGTSFGTLGFASGTGGGAAVTIGNPGATTAWQFNLPTSVGATGAFLASGGGGTTIPNAWLPIASALVAGTAISISGSTTVTIGIATSTLFADPTASVSTAAVNGTATTAMRSDAAPAISQSMSPTWSGTHTFNNPINASTATVGAPSYTFTGDTDTGIWSAGANTLSFSTGGTERLRIDSAGGVGIGGTAATGTAVRMARDITGVTTSQGIRCDGVVQSGVTTAAIYYRTAVSTVAASFTCVELHHYSAAQGTIGVGSTVTSQYGFIVDSSLTGATNNYGFYSNIASAANRWNFYGNGTANNYMAGSLGLGTTGVGSAKLTIGGNLTGATSYRGAHISATVSSDVTSAAAGFRTDLGTAASSFTLPDLTHYYSIQATIGSGSAVTSQYGFRAHSSLTGATNNYGFYSDIASAANRWNFYANGTARNWFGGNVGMAASAYINWNTTDGSSGYGIRDNSTVIEVKSSGGDWTPILGTIVSAKTSTPYSVLAADAGKTFTNEGTTVKIVFNLPAAAASLGPFTFYVQDTDGIQVVAGSGDTIRIAASVSGAAGNIDSTTVGSTATLVAINDTEWVATSSLGTWAVT